MEAGRENPRCLFCGREELRPAELPEGVVPPGEYLPFTVDAGRARAAFEHFAKSSIWHPGDLRRAELKLEPAFVAAWAWSSNVETHWAAMVPASTHSGVRPVSGAETRRVSALVPASALLTRRELTALGAFDLSQATTFDPAAPPGAHEIGTLTLSAASAEARRVMTSQVEAELGKAARKLAASHLVTEAEGRPVLVPVWVGAYRWKDRLFRVLVQGQSGRFVGKGPVSALRVLAAVGIAAAVVMLGIVAVIAFSS